MQLARPTSNRSAPAEEVPDPVGPASIPVEVYAGPNGYYTRMGDPVSLSHELSDPQSKKCSFVVLHEIRIYVVDVEADRLGGNGVNQLSQSRSRYTLAETAGTASPHRRPDSNVVELFVHTDVDEYYPLRGI